MLYRAEDIAVHKTNTTDLNECFFKLDFVNGVNI